MLVSNVVRIEFNIYIFMNSSKHILTQEGILTSFSIAKKITEQDFCKLKKKLNDKSITNDEFHKLLKKSVEEDTMKASELLKSTNLQNVFLILNSEALTANSLILFLE